MIYRACPIGFCIPAQGRVSQVCWYSRSKSNKERGGDDRYGHKPTLPKSFFCVFFVEEIKFPIKECFMQGPCTEGFSA